MAGIPALVFSSAILVCLARQHVARESMMHSSSLTCKLMLTTCWYLLMYHTYTWNICSKFYRYFYPYLYLIFTYLYLQEEYLRHLSVLGESGLAGTRMSPFWIFLELRVIEVVVTNAAIRRAKLQLKCPCTTKSLPQPLTQDHFSEHGIKTAATLLTLLSAEHGIISFSIVHNNKNLPRIRQTQIRASTQCNRRSTGIKETRYVIPSQSCRQEDNLHSVHCIQKRPVLHEAIMKRTTVTALYLMSSGKRYQKVALGFLFEAKLTSPRINVHNCVSSELWLVGMVSGKGL